MNHYQRSLLLRLILGILGFALAFGSFFQVPNLSGPVSDPGSDPDYSSPGWSNDSSDGGGWDFGSGGDSGGSDWDYGGGDDSGSWDYGGGGDSGSWDTGGGDSGSW